jgi:hypothetical protein
MATPGPGISEEETRRILGTLDPKVGDKLHH